MTKPIIYVDRQTGQNEVEEVFGGTALNFVYGHSFLSRVFGTPLLYLSARYPFFSSLYGWWQKQSWTKQKIQPFINRFKIDTTEFDLPVDQFLSFNDFFIRKLKLTSRPLPEDYAKAVIPADGRFWFYQEIDKADGFIVKGEKFDLRKLLQDDKLAEEYAQGSMLIARLCPTDYHRFLFPCGCKAGSTKLINGWWYSVNPIAVKQNLKIFTENKRCVTELESAQFGKIQYIEVGATCVGSIHQTYLSNSYQARGTEKGYFSFGGSALIILFQPGKIRFDEDLLAATAQGKEIRCLMGQSLGS